MMDGKLPEIYSAGVFDTKERTYFKALGTEAPTPLRTVREYEIELFLEDGGVSFINGTRNPIHKGDILIASPGDKRQSLLHFKALFIHFNISSDRLKSMVAALPAFIRDCRFEKYLELFSAICEPEPDFDDYRDIADSSRIISLLYNLRKDCAAGNIERNSGGAVSSVMPLAVQYIREHYAEPLDAETLAKVCHLSTSYFYRVFTKAADIPPNEFILCTRLAAAQSLLISSDLPIVEIAQKCGFNSQSYFSYCFKRHFFISPVSFRKTHRYPID